MRRERAGRPIRLTRPPFRRLRVYAFDPSLDTRLETAVINQTILKVPWEHPAGPDSPCDPKAIPEPELSTTSDLLEPGPVGEYLEVVDYDPASDCFYAPVDLNDAYLLAQDGLAPSEGNPQFHQQMVYAVAMKTISHFERALGRAALWASRRVRKQGDEWEEAYVPRLRLYPHALREANAFYTPEKKALLFGYFPATASDPGELLPGGMVFTCLSHDVIAHETTHALLDGLHRRFIEPTNPDVLAFHEAFADIVALFQHFTLPDVLRDQVARTRGSLEDQNLLGELAQQFGTATGRHGALRSALGEIDPETKQWQPKKPDATAIERVFEPHARGALLVAAVFDAFLSIYRSRIADLLRIATQGSGVLPAGELHPDLVNRLANEAAKAAGHVLTMCIRALDYLPPVDVTFGEYLRALITADYDLVRDDDRGYRIAMIEAFRRRGIYPRDVRTLSEDTLRWECPTDGGNRPLCFEGLRTKFPPFRNARAPRQTMYEHMLQRCRAVHEWLQAQRDDPALRFLGLRADLPVEVHSVRLAQRTSPDGELLKNVIIQITQRRPAFLTPGDGPAGEPPSDAPPDFWFRGGCTVIVDPDRYAVQYFIRKDINSETRLRRQRAFLTGKTDASLRATYFGGVLDGDHPEPFAVMHRSHEEEVS
jgi:hypothetical protein